MANYILFLYNLGINLVPLYYLNFLSHGVWFLTRTCTLCTESSWCHRDTTHGWVTPARVGSWSGQWGQSLRLSSSEGTYADTKVPARDTIEHFGWLAGWLTIIECIFLACYGDYSTTDRGDQLGQPRAVWGTPNNACIQINNRIVSGRFLADSSESEGDGSRQERSQRWTNWERPFSVTVHLETTIFLLRIKEQSIPKILVSHSPHRLLKWRYFSSRSVLIYRNSRYKRKVNIIDKGHCYHMLNFCGIRNKIRNR